MLRFVIPLAALAIVPCSPAHAQIQATGELEVLLQVNAACEVSGSQTGGIGTALLDFGSADLLLEAIEADTGTSGIHAFEVLCNPGVGFTVEFGSGENATQIDDRAMRLVSGDDLVRYQLYTDAGRGTVLDTVSGVGTGSPQAIQVFGRVPKQAAPRPGLYRDVVVITVTF